jgi:hypothetical protein
MAVRRSQRRALAGTAAAPAATPPRPGAPGLPDEPVPTAPHRPITAEVLWNVPGWVQVAPLSQLVTEMPLTVQREFDRALSSWQAPYRALEPLGHLVSASSPAGVMDGILRATGAARKIVTGVEQADDHQTEPPAMPLKEVDPAAAAVEATEWTRQVRLDEPSLVSRGAPAVDVSPARQTERVVPFEAPDMGLVTSRPPQHPPARQLAPLPLGPEFAPLPPITEHAREATPTRPDAHGAPAVVPEAPGEPSPQPGDLPLAVTPVGEAAPPAPTPADASAPVVVPVRAAPLPTVAADLPLAAPPGPEGNAPADTRAPVVVPEQSAQPPTVVGDLPLAAPAVPEASAPASTRAADVPPPVVVPEPSGPPATPPGDLPLAARQVSAEPRRATEERIAPLRRSGLGAPLRTLPSTAVEPHKVGEVPVAAPPPLRTERPPAVAERMGEIPSPDLTVAAEHLTLAISTAFGAPLGERSPATPPGDVIRPLVAFPDRPLEAPRPVPSAAPVPARPADDTAVRMEVSRRLGVDVSSVPLDRSPRVESVAEATGALAFTDTLGVHLPTSAGTVAQGPGRALLAHELTHAAQRIRLGGRVPAEDSPSGQHLEEEAASVERAVAFAPTVMLPPIPPSTPPSAPISVPPSAPLPLVGAVADTAPAHPRAPSDYGVTRPLAPAPAVGTSGVNVTADLLTSLERLVREAAAAKGAGTSVNAPPSLMAPSNVPSAGAPHYAAPPAMASAAPSAGGGAGADGTQHKFGDWFNPKAKRASAPGGASRPQAPPPLDEKELDKLAARLFPLITYRLRGEFRRGRNQSGSLTDPF